jgi:hypothetical protein
MAIGAGDANRHNCRATSGVVLALSSGAKPVVMGAGILKTDVKYDEIIGKSFVDKLKTSL